jgi:predicted nuclease with TOPRIM domain
MSVPRYRLDETAWCSTQKVLVLRDVEMVLASDYEALEQRLASTLVSGPDTSAHLARIAELETRLKEARSSLGVELIEERNRLRQRVVTLDSRLQEMTTAKITVCQQLAREQASRRTYENRYTVLKARLKDLL